jgi:ABC-type bacteriocin/lantibiotic exporter with double-glycine peptidase domain
MQKKTTDTLIKIGLWVLIGVVMLTVVWPILLIIVAVAAISACAWFVYKVINESASPESKSNSAAATEAKLPAKKGWDMNSVEEAELA